MEYSPTELVDIYDSDCPERYDVIPIIREYRDASKLPEIEALVASADTQERIMGVGFLLGSLIRNTGEPEAKALFRVLCSKPNLESLTKTFLIDDIGAVKDGFILDFVEEWMRPHLSSPDYTKNHPDETEHLQSGVLYLGRFGRQEYVEKIGRFLDWDCGRQIDPCMAIFALEELGHPDAIPYLERAMVRYDAFSTEDTECDAVGYARNAIEKIRNSAKRPPDNHE